MTNDVLHSQLMKLPYPFARKNKIIGSAVLGIALVVMGFFLFKRPPHVAMERYAPANSLGFLEVDSLADVVDGFTNTKAWRELAPVLGLSSQLKQVGLVTDLIGRTGFGPDEAVVAGRSQCAIAITGIESNSGETDEGLYIHLKPRFTLIIETHLKPEAATRLVRGRTSLIAQRIFGESVIEETEIYRGSELLIYPGPGVGRQLIASAAGSVVLIANQAESIKASLDTIAGRASSLADDPTLKQMRSQVGSDPSVFGYVTAIGIQKLVELSPLLISSRASDSDMASLAADLIAHISNQAISGLLYSAAFESGGVTEKYLITLKPEVAEALAVPLKPAPEAGFESPALLPRSIESLTVLRIEGAGELPERVLKGLSPTLDLVAGVALREFIIGLRRQYGLEASDSLGDATGSEVAFANYGDDQSRAMLIRVSDKSKIEPVVARYLSRKGAAISREQQHGVEIMISSNDDRRAAAFVGSFLVLGTHDQIAKVIQTAANHDGLDLDPRMKSVLESRPANASIVAYRSRVDEAGKLLLAISKLTRVTDGSRELLEKDSARDALDRLPRSRSFTEFRSSGVYVESHSAVGNFGAIGSLFGGD